MPTHGSVILQSTLLKTAANLAAQVTELWSPHHLTTKEIDWQSVVEFAVCGVLQAEIGWHWQNFLEEILPTYDVKSKVTTRDDKMDDHDHEQEHDFENEKHYHSQREKQSRPTYWFNIAVKLFMDQTVGSYAMNMIFLLCTMVARVPSLDVLIAQLSAGIWPLILNAWKVWPACALVNFLWVPVDWRVLVARWLDAGADWGTDGECPTVVERSLGSCANIGYRPGYIQVGYLLWLIPGIKTTIEVVVQPVIETRIQPLNGS
ncbi:hypothetical protein BDW74DRAFT_179091 [Aspergillus multicolor]|uniref:Mpv17/PMP22 family protein n=1 Tax=Aspergillus multicolor TaxID=41759 RepID=UPI003CCE3112